jgi:glyoxylase-like metal-dependent hydrolase (beta-lactamase superfamily II)
MRDKVRLNKKKRGADMKNMLICGMIAGMTAGQALSAEGAPEVFAWKVGRMEVFMLVENRGVGRPSVLINGEGAVKRRLPGGAYQSETNTFLVKSGGKLLVIDTGFGGAIFAGLAAQGVKPEQVDAVLLTHTHGDHIGGLQRSGAALFPRAELLLSTRERDWARGNAASEAALAPYAARLTTFLPGELGAPAGAGAALEPGVTAIAAFGHTPGHTAFMLESDGEKLLVWGDLMHVEDVKFPEPDISVTYDSDPAAAAAVRRRILEYAAQNKIPVAGMHLKYPAVGFVERHGAGFRFTPAGGR